MQRKQEAIFLFIFILIVSVAFTIFYEFNYKRIEFINLYHLDKGVLDISEIDLLENQVYSLDGEAEFYWNKLISPQEFKNDSSLKPDGYIKIPGVWNDFKINGKTIGGVGYATYRFKLKVNHDGQYGLRIKEFDTSYRIWANGKFYAESGKVGTSKMTSKPNWKRNELIFQTVNKEAEIVLQISNFIHRKGGAEDQMYLGHLSGIKKIKKRQLTVSSFLLGVLIILSIYHLILYIYRRKDTELFIFSILCFLMALRLITTGEKLILEFFPDINFFLAIKLEYLSYKLAFIFTVAFINSFYPKYFPKLLIRVLYYIAGIFCLIVLFTPVRIFSYTPLVYQVIVGIMGVYMLGVLFVATLRKEENSFIFFAGYIIFFGILVNDILYYNKFVNTAFLMHLGLFVLAVSQSIVLSKKFAKSFFRVEELTEKLELQNKELEATIETRTQFIVDQKNEIQKQANELIEVNKKLKELGEFKESLTGMIIHDLKNPLNIVLNFSKDQRVVFAGTQMLNLVHNLLDVQRYEYSEMKLKKKIISINKLIKNAVYQMNFLIEEKDIQLEIIQQKDYTIKADEDIMNRVFVNLLSNALKFTPIRGFVKIYIGENVEFIEVCISDTGPGIPADKKELVFEKFGQFIARKSGKLGSTGLGLTFCKMAVEAHKGSIKFDSVLGKGTTFCVSLPYHKTLDKPSEKLSQKIESKSIEGINFTNEEKEIIATIVKQLSELEIYQIGKIKSLLNNLNVEQSANIGKWITELQNAIWTSNQENFLVLLKMAQKE